MSGLRERLGTMMKGFGSPGSWFGELTRTQVWKSVFRHKMPTDPKNVLNRRPSAYTTRLLSPEGG